MFVVDFDPLPEDPVPWEDWRMERADVDLDEYLCALDAAYILQYVVGVINELPVTGGVRGLENTISLSHDPEYIYLNTESSLISLEFRVLNSQNVEMGESEVTGTDCLYYENAGHLALVSAAGVTGKILRIPYKLINDQPGSIVLEVIGNGCKKEISYSISTTASAPLSYIYPNPFNPVTTLFFSLEKDVPVSLDIYNIKGQKVQTIDQGVLCSGNHQITWNGTDNAGCQCSSGIYFFLLQTATKTQLLKALMLK
jgi:hypothetical protein